MRLAIIASHPVQYYAPLFRKLAQSVDLTVFYGHKATQSDQARAGFSVGFDWDVDLLSGYDSQFLENAARQPGLGRFGGVDTPSIAQKLEAGRFDAVLLLGWYLKSFLQALWAAKRLGIPVMVRGDSHLDTPRSPFKRITKGAIYPLFLRQFDAALVVGALNRAYWRHYGFPEARMFASPHCVDTAWFAEHATQEAGLTLRRKMGIGSSTPVALFAGKLVDFKRPSDLIIAAAHARDKGMPVEVLVAGSGPLEVTLHKLAASHSVPLHMLGFCNQSQMPAVYAAADVLVLPSDGRETWGLVANEAIACGKPLVLSEAVGCAPDLTGHQGAGRTYPLGNADACAGALIQTLVDPPRPEFIARSSQDHSLQAAIGGVMQALQAVISLGPV